MSPKGQQSEGQSSQAVVGSAEADSRDIKRWTTKRRSALVLEILRGDTTAAEVARKHGLTVAEVEDWKERFLSGAENALRSKPLDEEALKEAQIKRSLARCLAAENLPRPDCFPRRPLLFRIGRWRDRFGKAGPPRELGGARPGTGT
jgi:transposase-like protein